MATLIQDAIPKERPTDELSDVASTLIRQAVDDVQWAFHAPEVLLAIDATWCDIQDNVCRVCVAGAMILRRLAAPDGQDEKLYPGNFSACTELRALNNLRLGFVSSFMSDMGVPQDLRVNIKTHRPDLCLAHYPTEDELAQWCDAALKFADELEDLGY